mmetsp:Transcript_41835/g.61906  ORF Transcript_41835/g.61906 Transcript_41835/m.61906 type:complete len:139 (-) Transcript_41835:134-550(-)
MFVASSLPSSLHKTQSCASLLKSKGALSIIPVRSSSSSTLNTMLAVLRRLFPCLHFLTLLSERFLHPAAVASTSRTPVLPSVPSHGRSTIATHTFVLLLISLKKIGYIDEEVLDDAARRHIILIYIRLLPNNEELKLC